MLKIHWGTFSNGSRVEWSCKPFQITTKFEESFKDYLKALGSIQKWMDSWKTATRGGSLLLLHPSTHPNSQDHGVENHSLLSWRRVAKRVQSRRNSRKASKPDRGHWRGCSWRGCSWKAAVGRERVVSFSLFWPSTFPEIYSSRKM